MERRDLNIQINQILESVSRGQERGITALDMAQTEDIASMYASARRKSGLTVAELAQKTEISEEDLIDFELNQLRLAEVLEITEKLNKFYEPK